MKHKQATLKQHATLAEEITLLMSQIHAILDMTEANFPERHCKKLMRLNALAFEIAAGFESDYERRFPNTRCPVNERPLLPYLRRTDARSLQMIAERAKT